MASQLVSDLRAAAEVLRGVSKTTAEGKPAGTESWLTLASDLEAHADALERQEVRESDSEDFRRRQRACGRRGKD